jgi:uncharacterized protein (TIGR00255 family)
MLKSMTGYGESETTIDEYTISCEARALNGRFLSLSVKLPDAFQHLEAEVRKAARSRLSRGSVNINVRVEGKAAPIQRVNQEVLDYYLSIMEDVRKRTGITREPDPGLFLSLPGVISGTELKDDPRIRKAALLVVGKALDSLVSMRDEEGRSISRDLVRRVDRVKKHVERIEKRSSKSVASRRRGLEKRINELLTDYDRQRLNIEILMQIDKLDIHEELVRLRSHLDHFDKTLEERPPIGSKLIYLTHEMHREANTLSVKAMDRPISRYVVEIKEELERMREQLQNVE